ncbi:MAG: hypothetical protein ACI4MP_06820 [Candidatus Ventricola sp.]
MPGTSVGSIYAEATLNIDKFKASAAQMGMDTTKIVNAMEKAGASLEKAQLHLDTLKNSMDAANAQMMSAENIWLRNEQALKDLQIQEEEAAIKAAELGNAYEKAASTFGENSKSALTAAKSYQKASDEADRLAKAVNKQTDACDKSYASFKKAESVVQKYGKQIESAETSIEKFGGQLEELNKQLVSDSFEEYSGGIDKASISSEAFEDIVEAISEKGLNGLGSAISSSVGKLDMFKNATGLAGVGLTTLQRSLTRVIGTLSSSTLGFAALAAAVGYGAYKLYDYASGAAEAREALENLNKVAQEWKETNVTTRFEESSGLGAYGLSADDFAPVVTNSKSWMDELIKVWTDGKAETDDIVKEMVSGFTSGTETLRTGIEELQGRAERAGVGTIGLFGDMDADLARLDEIDAQVESLLKKRQNGFLTDDELAMLQGLVNERGSLEIKYHLVEDETSGFEEIVQGAEAALSRGAVSTYVWADAYASAAQGVQAYNDALNAEYDAQYKVISLMEDGAEKQQALNQLQTWYNEQATAGVEAYGTALANVAEQTGVFSENGEYAHTTEQLAAAVKAMYAAAQNPSNENMAAFANSLAALNETDVVEMTTALTAMQAAAQQSGTEMDSSFSDTLSYISELKSALSTPVFQGDSSLFSSLEAMFGENLDTEVLEVNAALNTETLDSIYDAWAAGEHADIIPHADVTALEAEISSISIDDLTGTVTAVTSGGESLSISQVLIDPITGKVTAVTSDGKTLDMSNVKYDDLTGYVTCITDKDQQVTMSIESLNGLEGTVVKIVEAEDIEKPVIELTGTVEYSFEGGRFSESQNPALEYAQASAKVDVGTSGSLFSGDFVKAVNEYVASMSDLEAAQKKLQGIDMYSDVQGYMQASDEVTAAQQSLASTGQAILSFAEDSDNFNAAVSYVVNGMQLLSEGALTEEDAAGLISFVENLGTVMDEIGASDIGGDLMAGIAEGMQGHGWSVDASNVASALETALRAAMETHSPSTLTMPIGTDVTAGIGEGMKDTSGIDYAALIVSESAIRSLRANLPDTFSIGAQFDSGFARGILAGKSKVISAAISMASAAITAAKSKLQIASPSKVTESFGEYFGLGFIEGVQNVQPRIDDSISKSLEIDPPAGAAYGYSYGASGSAGAPAAIDYDRLADAMSQRPMVLTQNGRVVATVQARDNAIARNGMERRYALGYGK